MSALLLSLAEARRDEVAGTTTNERIEAQFLRSEDSRRNLM